MNVPTNLTVLSIDLMLETSTYNASSSTIINISGTWSMWWVGVYVNSKYSDLNNKYLIISIYH